MNIYDKKAAEIDRNVPVKVIWGGLDRYLEEIEPLLPEGGINDLAMEQENAGITIGGIRIEQVGNFCSAQKQT